MANPNTMSNKNTKKSTSETVPTFNWCSRPRFSLSLHRGSHKVPNNPPPLTSTPSQSSSLTTTRVALSPDYKKRLSDLERDIRRLNARVLAENSKKHHRCAKRCLDGEEKEGDVPTVTRFSDGSFLHEITIRIGKPWDRLCIHVSPPTVAEEAATAAQVLQRMTKMKIDDLCRCLMNLMPMADITGLKITGPTSEIYHPENELEFLIESILFNSIKNFEQLVLEGLKIQMGAIRRSENHAEGAEVAGTDLEAKTGGSTASTSSESDWVVLVVLIQVRDPKEEFGSVGELMIGLIEAQLGENGALHFCIDGVHVAGLNLARKKVDGRDFMWSASMKCCGGSDGLGVITRNPDRLFPS